LSANPPSLLFCVGEQFYRFHEFVDEAHRIGVSKRLPANSIPEGLVVGLSKIFVAHPKAIVKVTKPGATLMDLAYAMLEDGTLNYDQYEHMVGLEDPFWTGEELNAEDHVPESMFYVAYAFSKEPAARQRQLIEEFGLQFCMGIFGFGPFGGFQVVLNKNDEELPENLQHLSHLVESGYVEPVHVVYQDGDDEQGATDEDDE